MRSTPPGQLHNTVVLLLWAVWKSRNRMIFDSHDEDLPTLVAAIMSHARLWVIRVPCRLDCAPLDLWCHNISL
jgi:hypothetical protein